MRALVNYSLLMAGILCTASASAQVCVDSRNETGTENGTALRPYRTVQAAVNAATTGQSVLVATGTYNEDILVTGKAVQLLGGFAGGSTVQYASDTPGDFDSADPDANLTELNGTGEESVIALLEAGASVVDGFRITGGGGSTADPFRSNGGGIFTRGGSPTIRNNTIQENDARRDGIDSFGGGIAADDSEITIEDNDISENTAGRGLFAKLP